MNRLGQQITNSNGVATVKTVYPGWYTGRATHVHIKVHIGARLQNLGGVIRATGGHVSHTGQFFFDDALTDRVAIVAPYSAHIIRRTRNSEDKDFEVDDGINAMVSIKLTGGDLKSGMTGEITVGVDPTATPPPIRPFGGPPNGQRPPRPATI